MTMTLSSTMTVVTAMTARMAALALAGALVAGCNAGTSTDAPADTPTNAPTPMTNSGITTLQTTDTTPGAGAEARPGMTVSVHYTGWLYDPSAADKKGKKFDSSKDHNQPFEFPLGAGQVIEGWDRGVAGMKVGGSRVLTIPPAMGYGARGAGSDIPPNATLLFEVDLLGVR